jgi:hypothetical protein
VRSAKSKETTQRTGHCFTHEAFPIPEHWHGIAASALALPNKQHPKTKRPDVPGLPAKAGTRKLQRSGHNTKQSHMKQISQLTSNSTKSLPGRWTKVTTMGCILALVLLGATSALPKAKGTARPFKASGIVTEMLPNADGSGTMEVVGTATHLGTFVSRADWTVNSDGTLYVWANFTAANGDTLQAEFPAWLSPWGDATITGGTGRFAGASGSYGAGFSGANMEIFAAEGTISY